MYLLVNELFIAERFVTVPSTDSKTSVSNGSRNEMGIRDENPENPEDIKDHVIISLAILVIILLAMYITLTLQQRSKIPSASITNRQTSLENIEQQCFKT